jgi:hypothetical protein
MIILPLFKTNLTPKQEQGTAELNQAAQ